MSASSSSPASINLFAMNQTAMSDDKHRVEDLRKIATKKKSILVTKRESFKRGSSRVTIHWKEGLEKSAANEDPISSLGSFPGQRLMLNRGLRWKSLGEILHKLRSDEDVRPIDLEETKMLELKSDYLARELGVRRLRLDSVELSVDQENRLEILKLKVKRDNDRYLKKHPELNIMLILIYRMLFKIKPGGPKTYVGDMNYLKSKYRSNDPKMYVANYVHHLNLHREELVLSDVDIPFDQPPPPWIREEEKWKITQFARVMVEKCAIIASQGEAYVNVSGILGSMLKAISPSEECLSSTRSAVEDILRSLIMSIDIKNRKETDEIVDEVLELIWNRVDSHTEKGSVSNLDPKESMVESFMRTLIGRVARQIRLKDESYLASASFESCEFFNSFMDLMPSKSILKRKYLESRKEDARYSSPEEEFVITPQSYKPSRVKFDDNEW